MPAAPPSFDAYLAGLPEERRVQVARVWQIVRDHIPAGYVERVAPKSLSFVADGEMYIAIIDGKNYISLHLMPIYFFPELKARLDASGKKLKGGKSCVNFTRADELPLDVIGEIVAATSADDFLRAARRAHPKAQA